MGAEPPPLSVFELLLGFRTRGRKIRGGTPRREKPQRTSPPPGRTDEKTEVVDLLRIRTGCPRGDLHLFESTV